MANRKKKETKKVTASEMAKAIIDGPAGNSGIPAPAKHGFNGRMIKLLTKELPNNQKIPPQAMIILDTIEVLGGHNGPVSQGDIVDNLVHNGLKTVQTPKRIYDFYRKDLIERKLIAFA